MLSAILLSIQTLKQLSSNSPKVKVISYSYLANHTNRETESA